MVDDCNLNVWFFDGKESLNVYLHLTVHPPQATLYRGKDELRTSCCV